MKKQQEIINEEEDNPVTWKPDEETHYSDEEAIVIKLKPNESIEGILTDVYDSKKWVGKKIYKIKVKNDDITKVLVGTTMLDRLMSTKKVGDQVKILRKEDIPRLTGNPLQCYKTFSPEP